MLVRIGGTAEDHEGEHHVVEARADEGDEERDEDQLGKRAARVSGSDGEELAPAAVAQVDPEGQRDRERKRHRCRAQRDVRDEEVPDLFEAADLAAGERRLLARRR